MRPFIRIVLLGAWVWSCLALASPASLLAQSKQDLAEAKKHYKRGKAHHDLGQYRQAAEEYGRAYELSRAPLLLFNLGQVYRLDGDARTAVDYYRRYLDAEPEGEGADDARKYIVELTALIDKEEAARRAEEERLAEEARRAEEQRRAEEARRAEEQRRAEEARRAEQARRTEAASVGAAGASATGPSDRRDPHAGRTKKIVGASLAAVGVVGVALGVKLALDVSDIEQELGELTHVDEDSWDQGLYEDGQAAERNMIISFAGGGALLATGAVLYFLGHRDARSAAGDIAIVPTADGDTAGVTLLGRF